MDDFNQIHKPKPIYKRNNYIFIKNLFIWIVGIIISFLPIIYNEINLYLHEKPITNFLTEKDLTFTIFNTALLLLIEAILINKIKFKKFLCLILIAFMLVLIIIYTISIFSDNWDSVVNDNIKIIINTTSFILLLLIGVIYLYIIEI